MNKIYVRKEEWQQYCQQKEEQEVCMSKNRVRLLRTAIINYKAFRGEWVLEKKGLNHEEHTEVMSES